MHIEFRWGNLRKVTSWKTNTARLWRDIYSDTFSVRTGVIEKLLARRPGHLLFGADFGVF